MKNCAIDANNAAIKSTIDLTHRFGSAAVAEGIKTMADLRSRVVMGCDFGQGMKVATPMTKKAITGVFAPTHEKSAYASRIGCGIWRGG